MLQTCIEHDGLARLDQTFFLPAEADPYFSQLQQSLAWTQEHYKLFGKSVAAPRLICWYGDPEAIYRYSGVKHEPHPWTPLLLELKARVEAASGEQFNSVLGNYYRDGKDSMGWHSDKEPELGTQPTIASLSFGAPRLFLFRHKGSGETRRIELAHGSVLIMAGTLQSHWQHSLPKLKTLANPRINLTFRRIFNSGLQP